MPFEADVQEELERLRHDNVRLRRVAVTLMDRVEQTTSSANSPFGFFQINAALAEQLAQKQAALHDSWQTLQAIFDAAPVGMLLFDPELVIRRANECAAGLFGRPTQEMIGRTIGRAVQCPNAGEDGERCGESLDCTQCVLRLLLGHTQEYGRARCEHELPVPTANGLPAGRVWLSLKAEPVIIGDARHVLLSLEDISAKKAAERQLREGKAAAEEASRLKSRFLSNVSHEIRTPLNGIMGFAEAILHADTLEIAQQQAQIILRESNVLLMLVNDLLDLVKIESGKLVLEHVAVDLGQLLEELNQAVGTQARAKGLEFVGTIAPDVSRRILSDPLRLRQILLNLASNAIKFTERGAVRVSIERVTNVLLPRIRVAVHDTGIGVPLNKQEAIFESFTQADASTTRKYGGTGLGLAIVRQLAGLLGGEVGVESTPGRGSTFWFVVPAEPAPPDVDPAPAPVSAAGATRCGHILFAEDYPTNQEIARLFLEGAGHRVTVVSNGQEAVDICARTAFDLILMDLHMPVMDGETAVRHIRQLDTPSARVPVIALTASADAETRAACLRSGISGVLTKPIRRAALLTTVARWLEQASTTNGSAPPGAPAPEAPAPAGMPPPLDLAVAIAEFGDRALVTRLLADFLTHADGQLAALWTALEPVERSVLRSAAHALKGAAATLEAAPLAACAARLEAASAAAGAAELRALVQALAVELQRLSQFAGERLVSQESATHA